MPADYKGRGNGREKQPLPGFVWLLAGLSIGLFVAFLVYLDKQPNVSANFGAAIQKELKKIKQNNSSSSNDDTEKNENSSGSEERKFDFYKILPELQVFIPDSETQPPEKARNDPSVAGKKYILQAGSFKNRNDAEKLKANLTLLSFEPHIQNVTVNGTVWHRVRTGPYSQSNDLYDKIEQLRENNINAIPMEFNPE